MRAKFVNESSNQDSLLKKKESLLKQKAKADEDWDKAWDKKEAWIEKYGESAWWANLDNYEGHLGSYARKNGRYPGFAVWNGEGPIQRKLNNISNKQSDLEYELEEIEKKLSGEFEDPEIYNDEDEYIPGESEYDPDKDYEYAMTHPGYKGPPGGPYTNYYNDLD